MSDTKKLRTALVAVDPTLNTSWGGYATTIYNDRNATTRRLKVAHANDIKALPLDKQWQLHDQIVSQFGNRIVGMYFQKEWWHNDSFAFCVKLKL